MRRRPHSPLATRTPSVGPCFVATRLEVFADLQHGRSHRFFESTVAREPVESIEHLARLACANLTITSHPLDLFGADKNVRRSEARCEGNGCGRTCRLRWSPLNKKKK